ncbi:modification methylase MunI [Asticcacaulis biprosthecium C19]|uniref:Modification methylase MunI n=1 Tax=Asticcacaulis biprosthecium C19 TaxID=715226 RepID=F4QGD0_9CAUL|nr:MT-A70 family methyltransferase [Asticcacaulis biprosthecium]EGF92458.1 modification methylase MunI [Asticcacaulis biprosthecium C19]
MRGFHFAPLTPLKYGAILADPPWSYDMRTEDGYEKSPEKHYPTMSEAELKRLQVRLLAAPDCLLWMWTTFPHLPQALRVMESWGFSYKTGGSWTKIAGNGKICMGTGFIHRGAAELWLIGTLGRPAIGSRSIRNAIIARRREHSRKPAVARDMLQALRPDCYRAEIFAREPWEAGEVWGWETDKFGKEETPPTAPRSPLPVKKNGAGEETVRPSHKAWDGAELDFASFEGEPPVKTYRFDCAGKLVES